jgi:hypothetical protein
MFSLPGEWALTANTRAMHISYWSAVGRHDFSLEIDDKRIRTRHSHGRKIMNRRTLTTMVLFGLAVAAFPQVGFAQVDPFIGTWQINLAKAKYNPGPPPKSLTVNIQGDGQNRKVATVGIGSEGNPFASVTELAEDGKPHPVTGSLIVDADAWTRVDARTVNRLSFRGP